MYGNSPVRLSLRHDDAVPGDSDVELLARFRGGEAAAFEPLVARHQPWIQRVCLRFLRSNEAARDATQEVFTRALDKLASFRGDNFAGWLKAIAVNVCLNLIDREKRWAPLEREDGLVAPLPQADAVLVGAERSALARRIIAQLPPKQKLVFCMKYIDECSYHDIERLTGFSPNEVKSFLQNARRNFEIAWRREDDRKEPAWRKTS